MPPRVKLNNRHMQLKRLREGHFVYEEFDNLWTNTAITEYLKETRNEILSKKKEITRNSEKNFAEVKKKKF